MRQITIRCHFNDLFRYDIYLNESNKVVKIDNEWHVREIPCWVDWQFDIRSLRHWMSNQRQQRYYIVDDDKLNDLIIVSHG